MKPEPKIAAGERGTRFGSLLVLALLAPVAGAAAGLLGAAFRLALHAADRFRNAAIPVAHEYGVPGFLFVIGSCAAAVALAAWLVRRFAPMASGSGIPHVEAVLSGEIPPAPPSLVPAKFLGGTLAIGAGLALGREGPIVQMGAAIAHLIGVLSRRPWPDCRVLLAAGAGAGLATAFNAPIAGAVFVLEELVRRFEAHIAIAALGASAAAIAVARALLGAAPDFAVAPLAYPGEQTWLLFVALGAVAGLVAALYNVALLRSLAIADRLGRCPVELRGAVIGAAVGALAWFLPGLVGGGDEITQRTLLGGVSLTMLPLAFLLRFALGAVSYAAATPGGLFAPLLVLGAQLGLFFGALCQLAFPDASFEPAAFAVVGMAAFFTGMVQAPVTGIVLVIEMTASVPMLLPMIAACFAAMLVPNLLGALPIYDALRERTAQITRSAGAPAEITR
ncbi:MAG: H(+)/Cl(-) exchange transporter ClcA [Alphaproteobacteria bacterium]|nr:H(+)/Cl(-) exchange transporter ClcA [Alphaproteobacteria bacterium]